MILVRVVFQARQGKIKQLVEWMMRMEYKILEQLENQSIPSLGNETWERWTS